MDCRIAFHGSDCAGGKLRLAVNVADGSFGVQGCEASVCEGDSVSAVRISRLSVVLPVMDRRTL